MKKRASLSYRDAGVDIDAGDALVDDLGSFVDHGCKVAARQLFAREGAGRDAGLATLFVNDQRDVRVRSPRA